MEASWENGVRSLRKSEMGSLRKLLGDVFFAELPDIQPHAINDENAGNLLVVVEDGEVVSHIATIKRHVSVLGCPLKIASLGGVATYESHRGKGHASALLEKTMAVCRDEDIDYIMVSGYRNMYHRYGCRHVGKDWMFRLDREQASDFDDSSFTISHASEEDIGALGAIHRREPVRWMRPPSDIAFGIDGWVCNGPAKTYLIKQSDRLVASAVIQQVQEGDKGQVLRLALRDYAGERSAIAGVLGKFVQEQDLKEVSLHVMGCDTVLKDLLEARGLTGIQSALPGTTMIIHFEQLLKKMRPYFIERIGENAVNGLVFKEVGDEYHVYYGGDRVVAESRGAAAQLIFGTWAGTEDTMLNMGGRAGEVLRACLPIPGVWYGVNYV